MSNTLVIPANIAARTDRAQQCNSCRFIHREGDGDYVCRRHPPTAWLMGEPLPPPRVGQIGFKVRSAFPVINREFWCGEWQARLDA